MGLYLGYTWTFGMGLMSAAMHFAGLRGAPRRSTFSEYGGADIAQEWITYQILQAVGGTFLFVAIVIAVILFIQLMTGPKTTEAEEFPVASMMDQSVPTTKWVENWRVLIIITVFLLLIAYTVPITQMFTENIPGAKGFKLW